MAHNGINQLAGKTGVPKVGLEPTPACEDLGRLLSPAMVYLSRAESANCCRS